MYEEKRFSIFVSSVDDIPRKLFCKYITYSISDKRRKGTFIIRHKYGKLYLGRYPLGSSVHKKVYLI